MNKKNLYTDEEMNKSDEDKSPEKRSGNFDDLLSDINTTLDNSIISSVNKLIGKNADDQSYKKSDIKEEFSDIMEMISANESDAKSPSAETEKNLENSAHADQSTEDVVMDEEFFDSLLDEVNKQHNQTDLYKKSLKNESKPVEFLNENKKETSHRTLENDNSRDEIFENIMRSKKQDKVKTQNIDEINKINDDEDVKQYEEKPVSHKIKNEIGQEEAIGTAKKHEQKNKSGKDDMDLLKAFGMVDDEDIQEIDVDGAVKKKARVIQTNSRAKKQTALYKAEEGEYTSPEQNAKIFEKYQKIYYREIINFAISVFFFLFIFYMELAPYLKWGLPYVLNINYYNLVYILFDVQILLIVAYVNSKSLIHGFKSILNSNVNIYYISFIVFFLNLIYTMITYFLKHNHSDIVLFNASAVFCMVAVSIHNLLEINTEILGFKVVSSKKVKYAMQLSNNSTAEMEEFRYIIPEDSTVGKINKTNFISGFFSNINKNKNKNGIEKYLISITLILAFIMFILMIAFKYEVYKSLSYFMVIFLASVPLCTVIMNIIPFYQSQKKAFTINSAIVGIKNIEDNSGVQILSLYDKEIFPSEQVKIAGIKVYGNNRIDVILQHLCAVFDKLNLTITDVFKISTNFEQYKNLKNEIRILSTEENGICFISNGYKLFVGNGDYFASFGFSLPVDKTFDEQFEKSSGSIMYLSNDNEILSKIYIKYEITADFYDIVKNLNRANICLAIKTFDPNINNTLLTKLVNTKKVPIKVIKLKTSDAIYHVDEKTNSTIVSKSSLKSFIHTLLLCNKTLNTIKSNVLVQIIAFATGILLTTGIVVMGIIGEQPWMINVGHILLFQIFWMIPVIILSSLSPF